MRTDSHNYQPLVPKEIERKFRQLTIDTCASQMWICLSGLPITALTEEHTSGLHEKIYISFTFTVKKGTCFVRQAFETNNGSSVLFNSGDGSIQNFNLSSMLSGGSYPGNNAHLRFRQSAGDRACVPRHRCLASYWRCLRWIGFHLPRIPTPAGWSWGECHLFQVFPSEFYWTCITSRKSPKIHVQKTQILRRQ